MEWEIILALVIAIPIILFPVAYVWYINIGGMVAAYKRAREKRLTHEKVGLDQDVEYNKALTEAIRQYPWDK